MTKTTRFIHTYGINSFLIEIKSENGGRTVVVSRPDQWTDAPRYVFHVSSDQVAALASTDAPHYRVDAVCEAPGTRLVLIANHDDASIYPRATSLAMIVVMPDVDWQVSLKLNRALLCP